MGQVSVDPKALIERMVSTVAQEEAPRVAEDFATMGSLQADGASGLTSREQLYQQLTQQGDQLSTKKAELLKQMSENTQMSKSQTAAMMLIGIMPMLIGGLVKGKKGISKGADASTLGTSLLAAGFEREGERDRTGAKADYMAVVDQMQDVEKEKRELARDEFKAGDTSYENQLNRQNRLQAAGISGGAIGAGLKGLSASLDAIAKSYNLEKLGRESESTKQPIVVGDVAYLPSGAVKSETADLVRQAAGKYNIVLTNLNEIAEMSKAMDVATFQRVLGNEGSDISQKYILAKNALMDIKKIDGLKGTEATTNLEEFMSDPSKLWNNLVGTLPGVASVSGEMSNADKNIRQDFKNLLELNKFNTIGVGDKVTTGGQTYTVGKIYPDGTFDPVEPVQ